MMKKRITFIVIIITAFSMFVGCEKESLCVATGDNGAVSFEYGDSSINEESCFELASIGKTVAAYIALKLVNEGKISLQENIKPYLDPKLITNDEKMNDITLEDLLDHTAGFSPSYELFVDKKVYTTPGKTFRYSGVGYIYLQSVIENVSGMDFEQAAKVFVFEPLDMHHSSFEKMDTVTPYMKLSSVAMYSFLPFSLFFLFLFGGSELIRIVLVQTKKSQKAINLLTHRRLMVLCLLVSVLANTAILCFVLVSKIVVYFIISMVTLGLTMYIFRRKKLFYFCLLLLTLLVGLLTAIDVTVPVTNDLTAKDAHCAYSFKSTASDMAKFCQELLKQYNNTDSALHEMFKPHININESNDWGLGLAIEHADTEKTFWHSGINPGFQSLMVLHPESNRFIVVLTNSDKGLETCKDKARQFLGFNGQWNISH